MVLALIIAVCITAPKRNAKFTPRRLLTTLSKEDNGPCSRAISFT